jgi:cytochrome c oxidase subunit 3
LIFSLFHLLKISSWPFFTALRAFNAAVACVLFFKLNNYVPFLLSLVVVSFFSFFWWKDVTVERVGGEYSVLTVDNLKLGIVLFILREVCFFGGFFWRFFHYSLSPAVECGNLWPPVSLIAVNPFRVPLLNTIVLLRRGATVTWSHIQIINNRHAEASLFSTLFLGAYFTSLQAFEYLQTGFTIRDSVFGSIFFIATGFHGLHVLIGSIFLLICLLRMVNYHFTCLNHLGYEMAIWYWHFVDVVWLFLFSFIYWWGF